MRTRLLPGGYAGADRLGADRAVGGVLEEAVLSGAAAWTVDLESEDDSGADIQLRQADSLGEALAADPPRLVDFAGPMQPVLQDRVVFHAPGDVVYCQRATDGGLLWHTTLRLPDRLLMDDEDRFDEWVDMPRRAVADGQTAVFNGADGLFAVGLITGRRIWARPYEDMMIPGSSDVGDWTMAARDGLLAAMPRSGRLALMRMLDGLTIWERDLRGERVRDIWMTEDRVLTADPVMQRVHLFRRDDGELIRQVLFEQPSPDVRLVEVVRTGGALCGPLSKSGTDGLMAIDLASGEGLWELALEKPLYALFKPKEGYLGVGLLGGDVRVLDATTGELVLGHRVPGTHAVIDGVLHDGTFLVKYVALREGSRLIELSALDVATGLELWRREDAYPLGSPSGPLPIVGGRVPIALRGESGQLRRNAPARVTMLDIRTGSNVGEEVSLLPSGRAPIRLNGDLLVLEGAGVVIIGAHTQIHALRIESSIASESQEELETDGA
jgi:outer membrane protein assembly factor BamB